MVPVVQQKIPTCARYQSVLWMDSGVAGKTVAAAFLVLDVVTEGRIWREHVKGEKEQEKFAKPPLVIFLNMSGRVLSVLQAIVQWTVLWVIGLVLHALQNVVVVVRLR